MCLENIIGITRTECDCFTGDFNESAKISTSGLYMDELAESPFKLSSIKAGTEICEQIQDKMEKARAAAIVFFKEELFKRIALRFSSVRSYNGIIGGSAYTQNMPVGRQYAGILVKAKKLRGASLVIKQIDTYFAQTATIDIFVYINNVLFDTVQINSVANAKGINQVNLDLPLTDEYGRPHQFRFVYNTSGLIPKNNEASCGCGSSEHDADVYFTKSGVAYDNFDNPVESRYAYGLVLVAEARCGTENIICDAMKDEFARVVISASIQRKSVEFLIADLLASKIIDRETMVNRDGLIANGAKLHNKFKNDVQWLAENIKINDECFHCNSAYKNISVGGIMM